MRGSSDFMHGVRACTCTLQTVCILNKMLPYSSFGGAGMSDEKWRWPKRIIPYTVGAEYSAGRKKMIQGAMQEWMDKTCIVFAEKGSAKAAEAGPYRSDQNTR